MHLVLFVLPAELEAHRKTDASVHFPRVVRCTWPGSNIVARPSSSSFPSRADPPVADGQVITDGALETPLAAYADPEMPS